MVRDIGLKHHEPSPFFVYAWLLGNHKISTAFHAWNPRDPSRRPTAYCLIFMVGVYYHLEDPVEGFQAVARKLNSSGLLLVEGLVRAGNRRASLHQFRKSEIEPTTFCPANIEW